MIKKAKDIFSITIVILLCFVTARFYMSYRQDCRFESQKLGVTLDQFKSDWGKPDNTSDDGLVLFYDCKNLLGHRYVFKFDDNKTLKGKYFDD